MTTTQERLGLTDEQVNAMRAGWRASKRSSDLGAAEDRYYARHGQTYADEFQDGWTDVAAGWSFGTTYAQRQEQQAAADAARQARAARSAGITARLAGRAADRAADRAQADSTPTAQAAAAKLARRAAVLDQAAADAARADADFLLYVNSSREAWELVQYAAEEQHTRPELAERLRVAATTFQPLDNYDRELFAPVLVDDDPQDAEDAIFGKLPLADAQAAGLDLGAYFPKLPPVAAQLAEHGA